MHPIAVDLRALVRALPDALLRPGASVVARVLDREGPRGRLSLAGAVLEAELPEHVRPGQTLRLQVAEASPQRLVLRLEDAPLPPAPPQVPLPDGTTGRIRAGEREAGGRGADAPDQATVAVTYDSSRLGALDFRLTLRGGELVADVSARAGESAELARDAASELRAALQQATGRPVQLAIHDRRDPFDAYA
jgi:hypothetical protein